MEKDFESWYQNQQFDPNLSSALFGFQHRHNIPYLGNTFSPNTTNINIPMLAIPASNPEEPCDWFNGLTPIAKPIPKQQLPESQASKPQEPCDWFNGLTPMVKCIPKQHLQEPQASKPQEPCDWFNGLTPMVNSIPKQQLPERQVTHGVQKKFLVFDQSNDRTTLIYSSTPAQYHIPKPLLFFNAKKESSVIEKHLDTHFFNPFPDDGNTTASEMQEDSEELKALLYSDDESDYSEDEEEQSTGHSPDLIAGLDRHECKDDNLEEVASSTGCRKRPKRELEDTASSGKSGVNCSGEADLSSCGNNSGVRNRVSDVESKTFPPVKRARKEKLWETINILQNLVPSGKSGNKDAMVILDEAIDYLRILKVKAIALGLDSL
nr:transcription factor bHLH143-like [Tanacetum cinerariifolium]